MNLSSLKEKLNGIIQNYFDQCDYEFIDLKLHSTQSIIRFEIITDRFNGGITIDECTRINHEINQKLEEDGHMEDNFVIEVNSPGIDRLLKEENDFHRVVGRKVCFYLDDAIENKKEIEGIIKSVNSKEVVIESKKRIIEIPLESIQKAEQVI